MSKLTDELYEYLKITNAYEFAKRGGAPGYVSYSAHHSHAIGSGDRRGQVHTFVKAASRGSSYTTENYRPQAAGSAAEKKKACVEMALQAAREKFGIQEWKRSPWLDDWVPVEAYDAVMLRLKTIREQEVQKAKREAGEAKREAGEAKAQGLEPSDGVVPALIAVAGLVERSGKSRQYIANLMERKGAPDPVEVEGLVGAKVFLTDQAVAFLRSQGLPMSGD